MSCKWAGSDRGRVLVGRHDGDCWRDGCPGCLPCPERHCRVCGYAHTDGTCAECLATTREVLHEIARMCDALPEEVEHRGVEGEAMMLLGPAADPEAWGHTEASVAVGRLPAEWVEDARGELHPLFVLGTWDGVWRDALDHDEPNERLTITAAVDYLDRTMTYMSGYEHVPFEDFARDLRKCRTHLAAVLSDADRGIRANVPCFKCGDDLERRLTANGFEDHWTCRNPRCPRRTYSIAEFNLALRASLEEAIEESA